VEIPYEEIEQPSLELADLLQMTAIFLWKDWRKEMEISSVKENDTFVLTGECPHCGNAAAFTPVTTAWIERANNWPFRAIEACRCIACNEYILGIICKDRADRWVYQVHFPLGKPDDSVSDEIPDEIKPDFQEALRCRFVDCYNATIEMCGRALEASCIEQGAPKDAVLSKMIDWVHAQGKITTPLKDMAHKIKLGRNRAAHPSSMNLIADDADAVIEFTQQYFHHVYVMPARMAKRNFDKSD
jgi:hypothetical protein